MLNKEDRDLGPFVIERFTSGPWSRDKYGSVIDASGKDVVFRNLSMLSAGSDGRMREAEANTDLIAAAPALLEALQRAESALSARCAFGDADVCKAAILAALTPKEPQ